ncbi:malonate--CoA ligase [Methylobacterium soli]|uniref:Malonyl-CoA synthase n=1 Tax=Methylobacterium soli TaxID=553447 RepID=A0A6L3SZJ4_9HYPH|nr:malonyl-CoA synthase [Methylobacterium soli]KAB1079603.1 malonyl-CoA synthase [Methylobacterium soli]GJE41820.1 Long-chain-fatty-acid--CoA ligase [Methylobacterium soli]
MSNHLFDLVRDNLPADPAAKTFIETPDGRRYSYADLIARSGAYGNALTALGVRTGDRVAVQVDKSPDVIFLYLGAVRAGAIFLPLNTAYTGPEVAYFLSDAEPALFVCDPAKRDILTEVAANSGVGQVRTLGADGQGTMAQAADAAATDFTDVARGPDELAAILYTSGTTGRSKGAMLSHENLASNTRTLVDVWRFTAEDVLIHALPVFHTHGLFVATNIVLATGATMLFLPRLDAKQILELMPRATTMMGVPTFYTRLLREPGLTRAATAHMRLFISGSAPLLAETHREWQARTGHAILERYGMTETNMSTSNPYEGARIAGTVGYPLPDVALRVVDPETGAALKSGEVGMIEVKGPNVFQGYWRMPEKTASEFKADGFFITGDLGKVDQEGYVHIVGRGKDLIITGGFNVYPKEIETEIDALPGIVESAVIGVPHADFGEGVTAIVVGGAGAPDEAAILSHLEGRLARFKLPKRVLFAEELPRNAMGKVQKNILREAHAQLYRD